VPTDGLSTGVVFLGPASSGTRVVVLQSVTPAVRAELTPIKVHDAFEVDHVVACGLALIEANGRSIMIKDILVHLSRGKSPDVAMNFGVSVAARMGAHLTGIAFRYEPLIPITMDSYEMPPEVIETQRVEPSSAR